MNKDTNTPAWLTFLVSFFIVWASRMMPHPFGLTPLIGASFLITCFAGWRALPAIILGNLAADTMIGFYDVTSLSFTYLGHLASGSLGLLCSKLKPTQVLGNGLTASLTFFGLSNLGVWLSQTCGYAMNGSGLLTCYTMALPFWRNQFICDAFLVVSAALVLAWSKLPKTKQTLKPALNRGFTLIELLVVVTIISILAAILFPVFAQAKAAAKKTVAISNLKQINTAFQLYNNDYDGCYMRWQGAPNVYWWGSVNGSNYNQEGLLYPYTKSQGIQADPAFDSSLRTILGNTGYGYNYAYLSPQTYDSSWNTIDVPAFESQASDPAETLAFASSARINNWQYTPWKLEGNSLIDPPSFQYPGVHARHNGKAVATWLDGHASSVSVTAPSGAFGYGLDGSWFTQSHLGDIMLEKNEQDYYYQLTK